MEPTARAMREMGKPTAMAMVMSRRHPQQPAAAEASCYPAYAVIARAMTWYPRCGSRLVYFSWDGKRRDSGKM